MTTTLTKSFAAHKIVDEKSFPFSPQEYSKFKFGCKDIARKFGTELAKRLIFKEIKNHNNNGSIFDCFTKQIVVISSPYCFIPTATFAMKDYFVRELNDFLTNKGLNPVQETKIHRTITYKEDYGNLNADERMKLIGNDGFHIDKEFLKGKMVLFLDDIKITGSHERVIHRMVDEYQLDCDYMYLYYAELWNKDIHPKIENYLNYYAVKCLLDLDKIIKNENFLLNTRTVKYILNSDFEEFKAFIDYQPLKFVQNIYHQSIGNSYHNVEEYKTNLNYIKQLLTKNKHGLN